MVISLFTLAQIFDETLPIINKSKHLKRGEYKVLSFYSMSKKTKEPPKKGGIQGPFILFYVQEDKRTTFAAESQRQISCI
jgi:hypothetical protein